MYQRERSLQKTRSVSENHGPSAEILSVLFHQQLKASNVRTIDLFEISQPLPPFSQNFSKLRPTRRFQQFFHLRKQRYATK